MQENYRQLCFAIIKQAVVDYFDRDRNWEKKKILKDLRSDWMDFLTDGMSVLIARQLELHPQEIKAKFVRAYKPLEEK